MNFTRTILTIAMAFGPGAGTAKARAAPTHLKVFAAAEGPRSGRGRHGLATWKSVVQQMASAQRRGVRFLVLPDLCTADTAAECHTADPTPVPGPLTVKLGAEARRYGLWIAAPVPEAGRAKGGHYTTVVLLDPSGALAGSYRKRTPGRTGSPAGFERGAASEPLESIDVEGARIGLLSADDLHLGAPRLASRGASVILVTGGTNALGTGAARLRQLERALSHLHGVALVVAGPPGVAAVQRPEGRRTEAQSGLASVALPLPASAVATQLGLPSVPAPIAQPITPQLVAVGRTLFFDKRLSSDGKVSCGSCHQPERAFTDGRPVALGVDGHASRRNVPTLLNVAYRESLFWDGSSASLEHLAKFPLTHALEMNAHYLDVARRLNQDKRYASAFRRIIGSRPIRYDDLASALGAFQRTLVSGESNFDRFRYGGDASAMTAAQKRGLALFTGKASCSACHAINDRFALLSDLRAHNTGVGYRNGYADLGRGALDAGADATGQFLTPSLRNVAVTAPYMHDGSIPTLTAVVEFYNRGGTPNPHQDPRIRPLRLSAGEQADLVAFLGALTGRPTAAAGAGARMLALSGQFAGDDQRTVAAIHEAAALGPNVVVLPGLAAQPRGGAFVSAEQALRPFATAAKQNGIWLAVARNVPQPPRNAIRPTGFLIDDEGHVALTTSLDDQTDISELATAPTPFGRMGIVAGHQLQRGIPRLAQLGARVALVMATWTPADGVDWKALTRDLARRHAITVLVANAGSAFPSVAATGAPLAPRAVVDVAVPALFPAQPLPLGLPPVPQPAGVPTDAACVALGRDIFFDPKLSRDGKVSCSHCHDPERQFADGRKLPLGVDDRVGKHNAPSLLNIAYRSTLFWDGRVGSLEEQVRHAVVGWAELDSTPEALATYLAQAPAYRSRLMAYTSAGQATPYEAAIRCLAAYERTLLVAGSPFDRFAFAGEKDALPPLAREGLALFQGKAGCQQCHTIGESHALFTDNRHHNTGVGYHKRFEYLGYSGDGLEGNPATRNLFRGEYATPSLRGAALTPPYMHDGSLATLVDVVDFYDRGGNPNPFLDPLMKPLGLTAGERRALVAFLQALTPENTSRRSHPSTTEVNTP